MSIDAMRRQYQHAPLDDAHLDADPISQFRHWFSEAVEANPAPDWNEPNVMTLATVKPGGAVTSRILLLKGVDQRGFVFYTNYDSDKGRELAENPVAAMNFFWPHLARQVRIEGRVEKLPRAESEAYFASRPRGSQLGAWASPQSEVIESREQLEQDLAEVQERFAKADPIPCPPHWGGYVLRPEQVEFWAGRENRLHDRIRFVLADGQWRRRRLAP
ncbi:pyridoxamine 5'-phosphate oxidase [Gallaecimonas sp. GXIMD4217]|uniref:pyridoxamine 5'-phosphate oxidase n=1 Tax=Gallaecimonas sp. GXIMD4217 TaxID=3131927 RepID=UPI00311B2966